MHDSQARQQTGSAAVKRRGRKRLHEQLDTMGHHGLTTHTQHHQLLGQQEVPGVGGQCSNPIKEFRQRQRMRERQEDERLLQLETRYTNAQLPPQLPVSLEQLYDAHGLNTKFPRVKTAMKRGKAADDSERTNRKKECARRDSKNYRERAKAKRDLIVRKIAFLENLFKSVLSYPKYQYIFS